jgi:hypothetical protein
VNAKRRVEYTRQLLQSIGLEGQRLQMINISSAMGGQFAFAAAELTAEVRRLGPNRLRSDGRQTGEAAGDGQAGPPASDGRPAGEVQAAAEGPAEPGKHERQR